jgi:hypothetical protein
VSFYTTELPEYMVVDLVRGFHPDVVRICSALTFTLLVVLAAAVAYGSRPADNRTAVVRAGITVAVMVGPTVLAATVLLNDPDHTGTAVPILLALLILDRGRRRWWAPAAWSARTPGMRPPPGSTRSATPRTSWCSPLRARPPQRPARG